MSWTEVKRVNNISLRKDEQNCRYGYEIVLWTGETCKKGLL